MKKIYSASDLKVGMVVDLEWRGPNYGDPGHDCRSFHGLPGIHDATVVKRRGKTVMDVSLSVGDFGDVINMREEDYFFYRRGFCGYWLISEKQGQ